jgi:hypothetical protein
MSKIISRQAADNADSLMSAIIDLVAASGQHPSAVYLGADFSLALEEETLSDGSLVYNILISERGAE